jgi:3-hexulose-6-phosphate synthase
MKLQLALDDITLDDAVELLDKVHTYVDIIEVGSPFIIEEGMRPVRIFKEKYPDCEILADTKIMDAGEYEAEETFKAGADYCTVLGVTDTLTIKGCLDAAKKYGKKVFVDMICVKDLEGRVAEIEEAGVNCIGVHVGVDLQAAGVTPMDDLKRIKAASKQSMISVAGGINVNTVDEYKAMGADIVIVGGGINHAEDPVAAAKAIYEKVHAE